MKQKFLRWSGVWIASVLTVSAVSAQETNEVEQLRKELREMRQHMQRLEQKLETLEQKRPESAVIPPKSVESPPGAATSEQLKELNDKVDQVVQAQKKNAPVNSIHQSVSWETVISQRSKGSNQTDSDRPGGFDIFQRSVELNVAASVDPFAKGWVVANVSAETASGEATFGIEEAALQTTSLPGNLTLTAGRFFGEFGRLSYIHDHELPFVNRPLALDTYIGGESRTDGLQLNWLPPVDHYVSITLGAGDAFGGDSPQSNPGTYRAFSEVNFWGRLSTYFDLAPDWQMELGLSGLWNPRTDDRGGVDTLTSANGIPLTERERRLAGVDFKFSYVPLRNNQFQSLVWGTEFLYSDNLYRFDPDASLDPANGGILSNDEFTGNLDSLGLYSYVNYKWSRQWSAGFLFDWVQAAENNKDRTVGYSPYITFALSHWNQLRLQYTHTSRSAISGLKDDDAVYLQWTWIIGLPLAWLDPTLNFKRKHLL